MLSAVIVSFSLPRSVLRLEECRFCKALLPLPLLSQSLPNRRFPPVFSRRKPTSPINPSKKKKKTDARLPLMNSTVDFDINDIADSKNSPLAVITIAVNVDRFISIGLRI